MQAPATEVPTNAPAAPKKKKAAKKKTTRKTAARKPAPELKTVPLIAGPAVVSANHVNVRSKAGLVGEVITRMTNGEPVTVVEEVHLKKSGPEEPSAWAKILLPPDAHVWVKSSLLDSNNTVAPKKLNLRAGPGEAYGVVGTLQRGDAVQTIDTKGEWTQIQAPTNAYAYMAAQYLKQGEEAATVAATPTPEPAPETNTMAEMPGMAAAPTEPPTTADTNAPAMATETPEPTPAVQEPPPPRVVEHEGIVRGSFSIQAPTRYELVSPDTHQPIDFLYTATTNLDLSRYKGLHIIVTGEESLDERWKNTPVITIERIQVLD
jgi:SH3-like domain-containing protein